MITKFNNFLNESARDIRKPMSIEDNEQILNDKPNIEIKNIIKNNSNELNKSFRINTEDKKSDWSYIWTINSDTEYYSNNTHRREIEDVIRLELYKYDNAYYIYLKSKMDNSTEKNRGRSLFNRDKFETLEDALNFLNSCGIDTDKITRE